MIFKELDEAGISYQIKRTKKRSMDFLFQRDGSLHIKIPYIYNHTQSTIIINKYLDRIITTCNKYKDQVAKYENNEEFVYLGKTYKIMVVISKHPNVIIINDILYLYTKSDDFETKSKVINDWLKENAEVVFNEVLFRVFSRMKNILSSYPKLEYKKYKSVWGLCRYKKNTISLNIDLLHTDIECIEYVIVHELSHFVYNNHSNDFHKLVNTFIDEKKVKHKLKNYKFKR